MPNLETRSEVKVTVTQGWYGTLRHPKMHPHTKFGIPTSKNKGYAPDTKRDRQTGGWTVRFIYFGGMKCLLINVYCIYSSALKAKIFSWKQTT